LHGSLHECGCARGRRDLFVPDAVFALQRRPQQCHARAPYLGEIETGLALLNVTIYDALRRAFMQVNTQWNPDSIVGNIRVIKKVIQPMPSCFVNGSSAPLTNLSVECDVVTRTPLKVDDMPSACPPEPLSTLMAALNFSHLGLELAGTVWAPGSMHTFQ
jgi:hypothetical protein